MAWSTFLFTLSVIIICDVTKGKAVFSPGVPLAQGVGAKGQDYRFVTSCFPIKDCSFHPLNESTHVSKYSFSRTIYGGLGGEGGGLELCPKWHGFCYFYKW